MQFRSARYLDLVNFFQQVHFFNQHAFAGINAISRCVLLERVNVKEYQKEMLGARRPSVLKIPFRFDEIPFFDTSDMYVPDEGYMNYGSDDEFWDAPLRRRKVRRNEIGNGGYRGENMEHPKYGVDDEYLLNEPYVRMPGETIRK